MEITEWIREQELSEDKVQQVRISYAAQTLPDQIRLATKWFEREDSRHAKVVAGEVLKEWTVLRSKLKTLGLLR